MDNPEKIPRINIIRFSGLVALGLSVAGYPYSVYAYNYFRNLKLGAFWSLIPISIGGLMTIFTYSPYDDGRSWTIAASVFSSLGVILGLIGATVDGISSGVFGKIDACGQPQGNYQTALLTYYGSSLAYNSVDYCYGFEKSFHAVQTYQCFCTTVAMLVPNTTSTSTCSYYALSTKSVNSGHDCGGVFTDYANNLRISGTLIILSTLSALVLSVSSCAILCGCCSNKRNGERGSRSNQFGAFEPTSWNNYDHNKIGQPSAPAAYIPPMAKAHTETTPFLEGVGT